MDDDTLAPEATAAAPEAAADRREVLGVCILSLVLLDELEWGRGGDDCGLILDRLYLGGDVDGGQGTHDAPGLRLPLALRIYG